jgi:phosphonoacetaldehyde hydrolase
MIYKNLVQLKVWPIESVVKVDDTVTGVGEGVNAGCWSVGVAGWSNYTDIDTMEQWEAMRIQEKADRIKHSRELLHASNAHYVADSIRELPWICQDINERLSKGETPQGMRDQVRLTNKELEYYNL